VDTTELQIVHIGPMRVAYFSCVGRRPEGRAWETLLAWADRQALLVPGAQPRFFGFNNPPPSDESAIYGFEVWMTVGDAAEGDELVRITQVQGGAYVAMGATPEELETGAWERFESLLAPWLRENWYEQDRTRQWLQEHIPNLDRLAEFPDLEDKARWVALNLFMPIKPSLDLPDRW
jgi:AraC family transcriptional regulator